MTQWSTLTPAITKAELDYTRKYSGVVPDQISASTLALHLRRRYPKTSVLRGSRIKGLTQGHHLHKHNYKLQFLGNCTSGLHIYASSSISSLTTNRLIKVLERVTEEEQIRHTTSMPK